MSALTPFDWHLHTGPADARRRTATYDEMIGDLRLGLLAALASWTVVLAPLLV